MNKTRTIIPDDLELQDEGDYLNVRLNYEGWSVSAVGMSRGFTGIDVRFGNVTLFLEKSEADSLREAIALIGNRITEIEGGEA